MSRPADKPPRVALFGHGVIGAAGIGLLQELGCDVVLLFGHRPGEADWQPSLAAPARELGVPCALDADLAGDPVHGALARADLDIIISLYYREIIPDRLLATARCGGINLHGSPLPRYRGRAPVNWMVLRGEQEGGAALHVMTRRPDGGPLLGLRTFPIGPEETAFDVLGKVRHVGLELLRECLPPFLAGTLQPQPQQGKGSYFGRRRPEDGRIDWAQPAQTIFNLVRAVTRPYPGAFTDLPDGRLFVWWAETLDSDDLAPGEVRRQGDHWVAGTASNDLLIVDWTR